MRYRILLAVLLVGAFASACPVYSDEQRERAYQQAALKGAKAYDIPANHAYAPHYSSSERAASDVAVSAHVLLTAYQENGERNLLGGAKAAADSLIDHSDMNQDGKVGWGRYWSLPAPSGDGKGGNTTYASGCSLSRNKAYDDEVYDDARIAHFLLDLYGETKEARYLEFAKRVIDDTWDVGESTRDGKGFAYFKTIGPCDKGWHIKNINMLMAVPVALLSKITNHQRYHERVGLLIRDEIEQVLDSTGPNFGYYSTNTMMSKPRLGSYVPITQVRAKDNTIVCNLRTTSGESCLYHAGLEARSLYLATSYLGQRPQYTSAVKRIMDAFLSQDKEVCGTAKTALGSGTNAMACSAYYCALRRIDGRYDNLCFERAMGVKSMAQDLILGLFWGAR